IAWAGSDASTSPDRASCESTASVIDSASTWKNRRAAGRVSENPNPSVPSDVYAPGTQRAIWSGTARIQSETATNGPDEPDEPDAPDSSDVTYGTRCGSSGCSIFHESHASASRRSCVHDVADHTAADTPQSSWSNCWARSAQGSATPEARSWAGMTGAPDRSGEGVGAVAYWYKPRKIPESRSSIAGAGGCGYGSLYTVR